MKHIIKNNLLEATIETKGAEIKSIIIDGVERMHDSNPKYWGRTAPILFPNIGTILDNYAIFNGVKYPIGKHGIIRDLEFDIIEQNESEILLSLKANEETKVKYPFNFELQIKYYLSGLQIFSEIRVINNDSIDMPFNLGLHPAFKTPVDNNENFEDYHFEINSTRTYELPIVNLENGTIDYMKRYKQISNLNNLPLDYKDYKKDAMVFENIDFNKVILMSNKFGVAFSFEGFTSLGIWTPNTINSPFICIEPWMGCADAPDANHNFITKRDIVILKPNQDKTFKYSFKFF